MASDCCKPGSLQYHYNCLEQLCRICGNRAQTKYKKQVKKKAKQCTAYRDDILDFYGIDVKFHNTELHPTSICEKCYKKIQNSKRSANHSIKYSSADEDARHIEKTMWVPHKQCTESINCPVCNIFLVQCQGAINHDAKPKKGRPKLIPDGLDFRTNVDDIFYHLLEGIADHKLTNCEIQLLTDEQKTAYICSICQDLYSLRAVKTACDHYYCAECLTFVFKNALSNDIPCPVCKEIICYKEVLPADRRFRAQLLMLQLKCGDCHLEQTFQALTNHECRKVVDPEENINEIPAVIDIDQATPAHQTPPPTKTTSAIQTTPSIDTHLDTSLRRSINSPLNSKEEKTLTHLVRRKLPFTTDKSTLQCRTRGQPIIFQRISKPRKSTEQLSTPQKRRRSRQLGICRKKISGGGDKSREEQHAAELRALDTKTRIRICSKAGIRHKTVASKKLFLAMKTHANLTWSQMAKQKRMLKSIGVEFTSEKAARSEQMSVIGDHLVGQLVNMYIKDDKNPNSVSGKLSVGVPLVQVRSLSCFVQDLLQKYSECEMLTWDTNGIPNDELWIKIGGDHGGGSFKICLQVLNTHSPNSPANTIVVLAFSARDYVSNIQIALQPFAEDIKTLKRMIWNEKQIRVFLFGDYEFLCKLYGLSGACGSHCCLWCLITPRDMQICPEERDRITQRKLSSLKFHHAQFVKEGKGKKAKAAQYYNAIRAPIWDIQLNYVCPPYLHILLGIVKKHHDLLEEACHLIDLDLAKAVAEIVGPVSDSEFGKCVTLFRTIKAKKQKRSELSLELEKCNSEDISLAQMKREELKLKTDIIKTNTEIDAMKKLTTFDITAGPVVSNFQCILSQHNIQIQAYHSRSFVGNHCHKYLQQRTIHDLCNSIPKTVQNLCTDATLFETAQAISNKFIQLNTLYNSVHKDVSWWLHSNSRV